MQTAPHRVSQARGWRGPAPLVGLCAAAVAAAVFAGSVRVPPRGVQAPPIELKDISGISIRTHELLPRPVVLIFGELSHEGVRRACADTLDVLSGLSSNAAIPILIASQGVPSDGLYAGDFFNFCSQFD